MAKKSKQAAASELTAEEALSLECDMSAVQPVEQEGGGRAAEESPVAPEPSMTDPAWQDFVMSKFAPGECDPDGRPMVHGLRRVTHLLLGPTLESGVSVVQSPDYAAGRMTRAAVVEYCVKILMCRLEEPGPDEPYAVLFSDAADVHEGNTDGNFVRFGTPTAATRAEARTLRKALRLRGAASEECTKVPAPGAPADGLINDTQVNFINVLARRLDVNAMAFVNAGKRHYRGLREVPYETAQVMLETISGFQTDPENIPADLKGYDPDWLSA